MTDPDLVGQFIGPLERLGVRYFRASESERHLRDVAMMLRVSGPLVDSSALEEWSTRRKVVDLLEAARTFDPR